jgi:plasmid stability protein
MSKSSNEVRVTLRLPEETQDLVLASALANGRSMNAEIVTILTAALTPEDSGLAAVERKLAEAMAIVRLAQKEGKDG